MLQIEYLPIEELKAYKNNAKLHPSQQIEQIKTSILEFGMNDPIAIWKGNEIIEGHGRLMACMELGFDTVPVIRLDNLSDEQRKAYALVHNKLTMNSGFDIDLLNIELGDIEDIDMEQFGFSLDDEIAKPVEEEKEIEFTEVLGEEHNYIVLYFDNEIDWLQMQSLIDIEGKMSLSTRRDGKIGENMKRVSVGRVFRGADVLERLRKQFADIN